MKSYSCGLVVLLTYVALLNARKIDFRAKHVY